MSGIEVEADEPTPWPFEQKNEDRRRGRRMVGRQQFLDARRLRRRYCGPTGGAFGRQPARYWNQLVVGTTGIERRERKGEDQ